MASESDDEHDAAWVGLAGLLAVVGAGMEGARRVRRPPLVSYG